MKSNRYKGLRIEMLKQDMDSSYLSKCIGISKSAFSTKITEKSQWTVDEMYRICDVLGWNVERLHELFPPPREVVKKQLKAVRRDTA